jgi:EmrB/QacA subfamily drug resistance transporter
MSTPVSKRSALLVASLASFLTPFMGSALNVALPGIGAEMAMSAVVLGWVPTSYLLSSSVFLVPFGRLADIVGRRRMFLAGISLYTVSSLFCALAPTEGFLITARVLQGISAALMFGMSIAILTSVFPASERGKALGINSAAVYIGLSLGPFVGGILTQQFGWRSIFWVNVPLGLFMIVLVLSKMKMEWTESPGARFDLAGSVLYSVALVAVMYGFSLLPGMLGAGMVATGIVGLLLFVRFELRSESPVLDINLFLRNRVFAFSNLAAFINYSATFAVTFLMSLYLSYVRGLTPQETGTLLVVQPVLMALFSPFAGRLSDRIEPRVVASIGMGVIVVGLAFFAFLSATTPFWAIVAALALLGFGFALFSSPNTNAVMSSVEKPVYGVAAGTLATMRMTGQTLSIGIAMLVFAVMIGRVQITPDIHPQFLASVNISFGIFAVLCIAGVFSSLARGSVRGGKSSIVDG